MIIEITTYDDNKKEVISRKYDLEEHELDKAQEKIDEIYYDSEEIINERKNEELVGTEDDVETMESLMDDDNQE